MGAMKELQTEIKVVEESLNDSDVVALDFLAAYLSWLDGMSIDSLPDEEEPNRTLINLQSAIYDVYNALALYLFSGGKKEDIKDSLSRLKKSFPEVAVVVERLISEYLVP